IETAHESVKATARELGISRAEAILKILSGELDAKQVQTKLVLFTAKDLEGVPAYLQGVGWVRSEERRVGKGWGAGRRAGGRSRRRNTRSKRDWSSDVCSSDLNRDRSRERKSHSARIRYQPC